MMHRPIGINDISLYFPHKVCFDNFSRQIEYGSRIAIIGSNGNGKSSLLKIIQGLMEPTLGRMYIPKDVVFGYVPQVIEDYNTLSGGQRLNQALTEALAKDPNVLCLDEPTNHLDAKNRTSLIRMIRTFKGTVIVVSHDIELLRKCVDQIWNIDNGRVTCFKGNYDAFVEELTVENENKSKRVELLEKAHKKAKAALQFEQKRAAGSKRVNANENDRVLLGAMKQRGDTTAGKKSGKLNEIKQVLERERKQHRLPEVIKPKFSLTAADIGWKTLVSISQGSCGYGQPLINNINFNLGSSERVAITGDNGSGKSTFVKAILQSPEVQRQGTWNVPRPELIGYLDQHYSTLDPEASVFELIETYAAGFTLADIRRHLNDFLFRKNEEVKATVKTLSGGEKARASLALIAAKTPRLLILDEVTNNLDLETREHVIEILKDYPGAMIVISHDKDFLQRIGIEKTYDLRDGILIG